MGGLLYLCIYELPPLLYFPIYHCCPHRVSLSTRGHNYPIRQGCWLSLNLAGLREYFLHAMPISARCQKSASTLRDILSMNLTNFFPPTVGKCTPDSYFHRSTLPSICRITRYLVRQANKARGSEHRISILPEL